MMMQTADGTTRLAEVSGERAQAEFGAQLETTFDRWLRNLKLRMPLPSGPEMSPASLRICFRLTVIFCHSSYDSPVLMLD